jgi:D-glucosaminate-6-phosphate ammonia-lyase
MTIYRRFGVDPVVNAAGYATRLGGALMPDEVVQAMVEAAAWSVDMTMLQAAASKVIARFTEADAGLVTSGASAALQLGAAAALARLDVGVMDALPDSRNIPNEIVMMRTHRTGYDHALRTAGAVIVDVGHNTRGMGAGGRSVERWELERAIGPKTAALAGTATAENLAEIELLAAVAADAGLPSIVDAAAQLPPIENLRRFSDLGVSLVAFSGGKVIRGPQNSGILAGDRDLIMSAALQMLDMDEAFDTWCPPSDFIDRTRISGLPQHGVCRGLKVSKETVIGLLTALELLAAEGRDDLVGDKTALFERVEAGLADIAGLELERIDRTRWGWPRLEIRTRDASGISTRQLSAELKRRSPAIFMNEQQLFDDALVFDPANVLDSQVDHVVTSLHQIFRASEPHGDLFRS